MAANASQAGRPVRQPERDHVRPSARYGLGQFLHRNFDRARSGRRQRGRHVARGFLGEDQAVGAQGQFGGEALDVLPIQGDDEIEEISVAIDRARRQADQGGRLAAADLRPDRAGQQAVPARLRGGIQQQPAGGDDARAAAADKGQRQDEGAGAGSGTWRGLVGAVVGGQGGRI